MNRLCNGHSSELGKRRRGGVSVLAPQMIWKQLTSCVADTAHQVHIFDWLSHPGKGSTREYMRELYRRIHPTSRTLVK